MAAVLPTGRHARPLLAIWIGYAALWIAGALSPRSREAWLLENLPVAIFLALVIGARHRFRFSIIANLAIAVQLAVHVIGAHYTYAEAPPGWWLSEHIGSERNHFDRVAHFTFGFLAGTPMHELLVRAWQVGARFARAATVAALLAVSAFYELLESWIARIIDDAGSSAFLGSQGDEWDAQKDMTAALLGSLLWCVIAVVATRTRRG